MDPVDCRSVPAADLEAIRSSGPTGNQVSSVDVAPGNKWYDMAAPSPPCPHLNPCVVILMTGSRGGGGNTAWCRTRSSALRGGVNREGTGQGGWALNRIPSPQRGPVV